MMGFSFDSEKTYKKIYLNGENISGYTYSRAFDYFMQKENEKLKSKKLTVIVDGREYNYFGKDIYFDTDLKSVLLKGISLNQKWYKRKRKNLSYTVYYSLKNIDNKLNVVERENSVKCVDAKPILINEKFSIQQEIYGKRVDRERLKNEIDFSLNNSIESLEFSTDIVIPEIDKEELERCVFLRKSFKTSLFSSTDDRIDNVSLALSKFHLMVVKENEEISFNKVVGERTSERGFKNAKVILDGRFIEGVGGGVCQSSTTIYNAVVLAGLEVVKVSPHSLPVSYVPPSRDAMVSYSSDLVFKNTTGSPIIILSYVKDKQAIVEVYGSEMKEKYDIESVVKEKLPTQKEILIEDNLNEYNLKNGERKVLQYGKEGLISESYLLRYKDGYLIERKFLRKDKYKPTDSIVIVGKGENT